jgi:hypothetical protein
LALQNFEISDIDVYLFYVLGIVRATKIFAIK